MSLIRWLFKKPAGNAVAVYQLSASEIVPAPARALQGQVLHGQVLSPSKPMKVGLCRVCGSPLTDARSIRAGAGKICAIRSGLEW